MLFRSVIEFSKDEKKIILSHSKTWDAKEEEVVAPKKEAKKKGKSDDASVANTSAAPAEKSTMGDLDALSALKEQMEASAKKK